MNKKILSLATIILLISGCSKTENNDHQNKQSKLQEAINLMKTNYEFQANFTVKETTNDKFENYSLDYKYIDGDNEAFFYKLKQTYTTGDPSKILYEKTIFEDENGQAYQEFVSLENVVEKDYDSFGYLYNFYHNNPFSMISDHDFSKTNKTDEYELNSNATMRFLSQIPVFEMPFLTSVNKSNVNLKDGKFDTLSISFKEAETYLSSLSITFKNINATNIEHAKPYVATEEQTLLTNALNEYANAHVLTITDSSGQPQKQYFTGRSIFIQNDPNATNIDEWYDIWINNLTYDEDSLYNLYSSDAVNWYVDSQLLDGYDNYDYQRCHFEKINGVFFDYDNGEFKCKEAYLNDYAKNLIPANIKSVILPEYANVEEIIINLDSNNKLSNIFIKTDRSNAGLNIKVEKFESLPFGIEDVAVDAI